MYKDLVNNKKHSRFEAFMSIAKENTGNFWEQDKRIIITSIFIGLTVTFLLCFLGYRATVYANNLTSFVSNEISEEVLRFHILANSNSEEDQALKIEIKDEVISLMELALSSSNSRVETIENIENDMDKIIELAEKIISENGYDYTISGQITDVDFPTKTYGDMTLPAGNYKSLQLIIGEGKGDNWWCCMFPPLCFVDITSSSSSTDLAGSSNLSNSEEIIKLQLSETLSEEAFMIVTDTNNSEVKFKLKLLELLNL